MARSNVEAEYRSTTHGVCKVLWLRTLLCKMGFETQVPMSINSDNKAAISISHNPIQHDQTKHIKVNRHFIQEKLLGGLICTPFVTTDQQLADVLTVNKGSCQGTTSYYS